MYPRLRLLYDPVEPLSGISILLSSGVSSAKYLFKEQCNYSCSYKYKIMKMFFLAFYNFKKKGFQLKVVLM